MLMRLKKNEIMRNMCVETTFLKDQLIQPIFVADDNNNKEIPGIPNNFVMNLDQSIKQIESDLKINQRNYLIFMIPKNKTEYDFNLDFQQKIIFKIKDVFKDEICLWADVCLCSMTVNGHCCLFDNNNNIDLNKTLYSLSKLALSYAQAGIDGVAPSDMMDGRTRSIRNLLDDNKYNLIPIMSYSTKFASNFYGPFRHAANSSPSFGDRKNYQLDFRNKSEAIRSSIRCFEEGADLLMVKPGQGSIDLIEPIKNKTGLMVGAYQVSGEYAGMALAAEKKLINFNNALLESWHVMKRAGAQFIISYGARKSKELGISE